MTGQIRPNSPDCSFPASLSPFHTSISRTSTL